jgi:hypothetical protein
LKEAVNEMAAQTAFEVEAVNQDCYVARTAEEKNSR